MYVVLGGRVRLSKAVIGQGGARVHSSSSSSSSNLAVFSQAGKARKRSLFGSIDTSNEQLVVGDFGRGESIGALDVMTDAPRNNTATAMRDAELVRVSAAAFKLGKWRRFLFLVLFLSFFSNSFLFSSFLNYVL
jgi:CRP-like cAMP-binding protein